MDFNGCSLRPALIEASRQLVMFPMLGLLPQPTEEKRTELLSKADSVFKILNDHPESTEFVSGNTVTIADL